MAKRGEKDKFDAEAVICRERVTKIIDSVDPAALVASIKRAPSLRGMILGYIAEEMFETHLPRLLSDITDIVKHDDHNRAENKADRTVTYNQRRYTIQLKSVQTNSICRHRASGVLMADVQNDASDARAVRLPNGETVVTTCYQRGEYDILAVPLFPFTERWNFAYKRNRDCRATNSKKYSISTQAYLLNTIEKLTWPLGDAWTMNIKDLFDDTLGVPIGHDQLTIA